jgi:hypothetical protein
MATYVPAFKITEPYGPTTLSGSNQGIHERSTTQTYRLGTRVWANDPVLGRSEFVYCKGVASTAAGECIQINGDFTTTRAAGGTIKGSVGCAMSASVANEYGWYCIFGRCYVFIAGDVGAEVAGYTTATAGVWADDIVAGSQIVGSHLMTGTDAAGSAIPDTTDTLPAHFTIAVLRYPCVIKAV